MTDDGKPITQQQAADILGVTLRHFQRLMSEPGAPPKLVNANGRASGFRCGDYGKWLRSRWMAEAGVGGDGKVYDEKLERARLLHHQANNESMKEATNRGELLPVELVVDLGSQIISAARGRILAIHSKVRGRFPELEQSVLNEIESLAREALTELGDDGLHPEIRRRAHKTVHGLVSAPESDAKPMG